MRDNFYSKLVLWVKVTLPLVALALLSTLFLFASTPDPDAALPYAQVDVEQISREQRVSQPRFAGVLDAGRELVIIAETASAVGQEPDLIRAEVVEGRMDMAGEDYMTLEAARAQFDMAGQIATLNADVTLRSSLGYQLESDELIMALNEARMRSELPVHVIGPGLDLTANTMEWVGPDGEAILSFTGDVRLIYDPEN